MKRTFLQPPTEEGKAPTPITVYIPRGKKRGRGTPGAFGGQTKAQRKVKQMAAFLAKQQELKAAHKIEVPVAPANPPATP